MNEQRQGLDVGKVFSIVGARWKLVVATMLVSTMVAYSYVTFLAHPVYETTAQVTYQAPDRSNNPTGGALPSTGMTREDVSTLVASASRRQVVEAAAAAAGVTPSYLQRSVKVQPFGEASVVAFVARAGAPATAAKLANTWASTFVADRKRLAMRTLDEVVKQRREALNAAKRVRQNPESPDNTGINMANGSLQEALAQRTMWKGAISVSLEAPAPQQAVWPRTTLTIFAALVIGFGLGAGAALLTARVDQRLHADDLGQLPAPVIARVPRSLRAPRGVPLGPSSAEPIVADAFAGLGSRVMLDRVGDGAHVILVTSARSGEGKSSVASNLASALALGGRRVVLIDADMRRPTQDIVFPMLANRPGLSQVLTRGADVESALTLIAPNLAAIPSGPRHANASVLLASVALRQLLERIAQISEVVVIDAPPVLAVNDALAIAPSANHVLLVARQDTSDMGEVHDAHQRLSSAAQTPQSIVLVGTERPQGYGYDNELRGGRAMMPARAPQAAAAPIVMPAVQAHGAPAPAPAPAAAQPAAAPQMPPPPPMAAPGEQSSSGAVA